MVSEREIRQGYRVTSKTVLDPEGRDTGEAPDKQSYDRAVQRSLRQPSGTDNDGGSRMDDVADVYGAPNPSYRPMSANVAAGEVIPNVDVRPGPGGYSYFFIPKADAKAAAGGWESPIHLGDDDGSGKNLGGIRQQADQLNARMDSDIQKYNALMAQAKEGKADIEKKAQDEGIVHTAVLLSQSPNPVNAPEPEPPEPK